VGEHIPRGSPGTPEAAVSLLEDPTFDRVCLPEDPDRHPDEGDVLLFFNDLVSHTFHDLVEQTAGYLGALAGAARRGRADRRVKACDVAIVTERPSGVLGQQGGCRWTR
jgi:hypothetical protein